MKILMRFSRLCVVIVAVALLASGCTLGPTEVHDDDFAVGASIVLVVDSENGSIEVASGLDNAVHVQIHAVLFQHQTIQSS